MLTGRALGQPGATRGVPIQVRVLAIVVLLGACMPPAPHRLLVGMSRDDPTCARRIYSVAIHEDGTLVVDARTVGVVTTAQRAALRSRLAALRIGSMRTEYAGAVCTSRSAHGSIITLAVLADGRVKTVLDDHMCSGPRELTALRVFERAVEDLVASSTGRRMPRWQDDPVEHRLP